MGLSPYRTGNGTRWLWISTPLRRRCVQFSQLLLVAADTCANFLLRSVPAGTIAPLPWPAALQPSDTGYTFEADPKYPDRLIYVLDI